MADEKRIRAGAVGGKITDNPLTSGATTLNATGLGLLPTLASDEYCALILNPDGRGGINPEKVWLTAHTSGADSGTIGRAKEGTAGGVDFPQDTDWIHGPTIMDFPQVREIAATSDLAVTTTEADVPGATFTVTVPGRYRVTGVFDIENVATGVFTGLLHVNGVAQGGQAIADVAVDRITISQVWAPLVGAGQVVKLRADMTAGTADLRGGGHTKMQIEGPFGEAAF